MLFVLMLCVWKKNIEYLRLSVLKSVFSEDNFLWFLYLFAAKIAYLCELCGENLIAG